MEGTSQQSQGDFRSQGPRHISRWRRLQLCKSYPALSITVGKLTAYKRLIVGRARMHWRGCQGFLRNSWNADPAPLWTKYVPCTWVARKSSYRGQSKIRAALRNSCRMRAAQLTVEEAEGSRLMQNRERLSSMRSTPG